MSFIETMETRYTTKQYDGSKKIDAATIDTLKEILHLSPSSINSQPWNFTFVENDELKDQLAEASYFNADRIRNASHLVVFNVINDLPYFEEVINANLPEGAVGYYNTFLKPKPEAEVKNWMTHQVYLALGVFLSACANMGIDSTPMEGIVPEAYTEILGLDKHETVFAVAIGYRDPADDNQVNKTPKQRRNTQEVITTL
ncbi:nitroreductase family protein [Persicobacter psychrovividus]|uniref:NAD(P)H-dependent oxidoreductase n=1 Tax=Persicobacter psychrovividus TaxID=387638 RepID=A0ABM7VCT2_9BACT|nr:NAD(P)H-dependent oxidoreductase [Persicobacter psychrovividus]